MTILHYHVAYVRLGSCAGGGRREGGGKERGFRGDWGGTEGIGETLSSSSFEVYASQHTVGNTLCVERFGCFSQSWIQGMWYRDSRMRLLSWLTLQTHTRYTLKCLILQRVFVV